MRRFDPRDIKVKVEVEVDIRSIPPPSPLTPSPGQLTHDLNLHPNQRVWPFEGDEAAESHTDVSSWLRDDVSEESVERGLAPRPPPAVPPKDIPDLMPKENRTSKWSDN